MTVIVVVVGIAIVVGLFLWEPVHATWKSEGGISVLVCVRAGTRHFLFEVPNEVSQIFEFNFVFRVFCGITGVITIPRTVLVLILRERILVSRSVFFLVEILEKSTSMIVQVVKEPALIFRTFRIVYYA